MTLLYNAAVIALLSLIAFLLGYFFYARYLSKKIFELNPDETCPAHEMEDNVDYVPADRHVLFGHHFCSITGAAPIVGPAVAVIWGWVPAVLWVVFGTIFIGAVHDFGTLVISARNKGQSISDVAGDIVGPKSRTLFLALVWVLVWLVIAVFAVIIGSLFVSFPASVIPVNFEIIMAIIIGLTIYRWDGDLLVPSIVALIALYGMIVLTVQVDWMKNFDIGWFFALEHADWMSQLGFSDLRSRKVFVWVVFLLGYSFIASVIPVWILLQPRDYINGHQLFVGLGALYLGLIVAHPQIPAPEFNESVGYPGGLATVSWTGSSKNKPETIPEGTLLVPADQLQNNSNVLRISSSNKIPRPRFFTYEEISSDQFSKKHHIRSTSKKEGEHFDAELVPVLTERGTPWVYHKKTKEIRPHSHDSGSDSDPKEIVLAGIQVSPEGPAQSAPPVIPFLFITIACGAISGFHGLVSSGTTSKQLNHMDDCQYIGYGGMLGEGMLGLMSVLAATAGFSLLAQQEGATALSLWHEHYASWGGANAFGSKIGAFVQGGGAFLGTLFDAVLGTPLKELSNAIVAIIVVSFAATTLDSATRIQRYIFTELVRPLNIDLLENRYVASGISAFTPLVLVFGGGWLVLWPLFGATNQMLAGLSMLVITVYLFRKKKALKNYLVPMIFLIFMTGLGLFLLFLDFLNKGFLQEGGSFKYKLLTILSIALFAISIWIIIDGVYRLLTGDREDPDHNEQTTKNESIPGEEPV